MKSVHSFAAKMNSDLALEQIQNLVDKSTVLDPMAGSGTTLRQAVKAGHKAIGFDLDPLAVLMSKVATTPCDIGLLNTLAEKVVTKADSLDGRTVYLGWIDDDKKTKEFVNYWFAPPQRLALRKLAKILMEDKRIAAYPAERNALMLTMSRLIITKEPRASLARDTSRSRPHKVADASDCNIFPEFIKSAKRLGRVLEEETLLGRASIKIGDARNMRSIKDKSIDAVITSPPYLNAIDYMRGHRLSLVWMGYSMATLRDIRAESIGAERGICAHKDDEKILSILSGVGKIDALPKNCQQMIKRYARDIDLFMSEIARVMRVGGRATFVTGNSRLHGVFVRNSHAVLNGAQRHGFQLIRRSTRRLPMSRRSLPIMANTTNALNKRIRTESVMVFERLASQPT